MADSKISALSASTTPLAGTEVLPLVQGGVTKKVAVTNLTGTTVSNAGEVGIGGDTAGVVAGVAVTSKFCVKQDGTNPVAGFVKAENTTAGSGSATFACRSRGTLASPTAVQSGDALWNMYVAGHDGTDLALAAEIQVQVDGVPGSNDMPGSIVFKTTPDGSQTPVEAMRITSAQNVALATGNLVQGTAAKGINFTANTPAAGMTSQLLNWYEEGTWTPVDTSGAGLAFASFEGNYARTGNVVVATAFIVFPATADTSNVTIGGLPFTCKNTTASMYAASISVATYPIPFTGAVISNTKNVQFITFGATNITNVNMSNNALRFTATYQV